MVSKELSNYIETIRKKRNITLKALTDDIVSTRQYKRYISGDSEMPFRVFLEFSERLGFNQVKILAELETEKIEQSKIVETFYNHIARNEWDKAEEYRQKYNEDFFITDDFKMYFKVSCVMLEYLRDKLPKPICAERCKEIIDYPTILEKELYDPTELIVLTLTLTFLVGEEKEALMNKLSNLILQDKVTIGTDYFAKLYIVIRLAKEHGMRGENEKVIELCEYGLDILSRPQSYMNLDFLYYYLSLAYYKLDDKENHIKYVKKLYYYNKFRDDDRITKKYNTKMHNDFGKSFEEILELN